MKNYVTYVNDHSGSMQNIARAAAQDYNANIAATKNAASTEMLDTVVSVFGVGMGGGVNQVLRQVTISNPHVLKPITDWPCPGGTPLFDGIGMAIEFNESLPDAQDPNVSFLIQITSDGQEMHSHTKWRDRYTLGAKIAEMQRTGRWTFVARIPRGCRHYLDGLNIPAGNIVEWDTTAEGMAKATAQTTAAMTSFYAARSKGATSSNVFYTNTSAVDTSKLVDIQSKTSLYVVPSHQDGVMVRDFILGKRTEYLIGAAFYQLVKTEPRVQPNKLILIRDKKTGAVYAGTEARTMLGLDTFNNARVHPNHGNGNYDIFIQSESVNRKLPANSGVLYWAEKGRPVTAEDMKYLLPKTNAAPAVPQMMQAPATGRPTPSPIAKPLAGAMYNSREEARRVARSTGKSVKDLGQGTNPRWLVA